MLTLGELWDALTGNRPSGGGSIPITRVAIDSRQVIPGAVFFALKGEQRDGHEFIGEALARGAIAIVAEARARGRGFGGNLTLIDVAGLQPDPTLGAAADAVPLFITENSLLALQKFAAYWRRRFPNLTVVGVTGSLGKTSSKELIYSVLKQRYVTLKSEGNLNSETGLPLTIFNLTERHQRAVLEMGMYAAGEIRALAEIAQPKIGVVTLVAPMHLERLGSIEAIADAKAELVQALPPDGWAVLNGDDFRVRAMRDRTPARTFTYGLDRTNDLWADEIESHGLEGISFALHYGQMHMHVKVPLLGRHSVHTSLAAASVGLVQNLSWEEILHGLQDVSAQLRLIAVPGKNGTTVLDDTYNASPPSTLSALNLVGELKGRKLVVLGDMLELGDFETEGHRLVGIRAAHVADVILAVGPLGKLIGDAAREEGHSAVHFADDNAEATAELLQVAKPGDFILVKGSRGAHMEDIVQAITLDAEDHPGAIH